MWWIVYDSAANDGKRFAVINAGFRTEKEANDCHADRIANGEAFPDEYVWFVGNDY